MKNQSHVIWRRYNALIVNFENIKHMNIQHIILTLNK